MTIAEIHKKLNGIEASTDVCCQRIGGFYYWDALRFKCYYAVCESLGIYEKSQRYARPKIASYMSFLWGDFLSFLRVLRTEPSGSEVLFLANARRKLDSASGLWIDPYTDPVLDRMSSRPIVLEARIGGKHCKPAWTKNLGYYDVLRYIGGVVQPIVRQFTFLTKRERIKIKEVEKEIKDAFGLDYPLEKAAIDALCWHKTLVPIYAWFLKKMWVKTLVMICSYGKEHWIKACRNRGVRTIELQHGTITRFHPGYHYPEGTTKHYVPDEFWAFGEYWMRTVRFPSKIKLRPRFGFPYLERVLQDLNIQKEDDLLLVISQGIIGKKLSSLVVDALPLLPASMRILYKLHPGETLGWKVEYPWLLEHSDRIKVVEGDSPSLYELMARAKWQLGVSSTALFEGMRLGCRTLLADFASIEYMSDILGTGRAVLVKTAGELPEALKTCPLPDGKIFFDRDESLLTELDTASPLGSARERRRGNMQP